VYVNLKGIYRLSGVKSQVEQLCQSFETDEHAVDLSLHHPNVIANVLKLYFRQVFVLSLYQFLILILSTTRNTFCGTWYLPHSKSTTTKLFL